MLEFISIHLLKYEGNSEVYYFIVRSTLWLHYIQIVLYI